MPQQRLRTRRKHSPDAVTLSSQQEETEPAEVEPPVEKPNAFCIQLFVIDKNHEMR